MSALTLARRAPVADLVGVQKRRKASGVLVRDGLLLVVCDNTGLVSILDPGLALGPHREIPLRGGLGRGYEDIAADPAAGRLFVLVEAVPNELPDGPPYRPAAPSATPGPRQAGQPRPSRSTSRSTTSPCGCREPCHRP